MFENSILRTNKYKNNKYTRILVEIYLLRYNQLKFALDEIK